MVPVAHVGWGPDFLFVFVFYRFILKIHIYCIYYLFIGLPQISAVAGGI